MGKALLVWLSPMKTENGMIFLSKSSESGVSVDSNDPLPLCWIVLIQEKSLYRLLFLTITFCFNAELKFSRCQLYLLSENWGERGWRGVRCQEC